MGWWSNQDTPEIIIGNELLELASDFFKSNVTVDRLRLLVV